MTYFIDHFNKLTSHYLFFVSVGNVSSSKLQNTDPEREQTSDKNKAPDFFFCISDDSFVVFTPTSIEKVVFPL